ncbi:TMEM175 family protein [Marinicella litoralis]|uniref:Uncharacterized protein DUF1211 n=1 Tax=Marinicella litoralis TaxID=644220 RepID=A0A4R6XHG4_9GAMM|nr:TMEM175 family protein [Marinicella litoralis]TDR16797.1 uncharacterized protein DUF1211 [Marinicella litoralis]
MQALKDEFLADCPTEKGFRQRGMNMTRIEVFVDAAFAFAVTMLVISIDQIPRSVPELIEISKYIPGFVLSVAQLVFVWHSHATWSKQFGLEDGKTVFLSSSLLVVMLIFIYPLKMMFQGLFAWLTDGYLPSQYNLSNYDELRILFLYFAAGFFLISLIFLALYKHALNRQKELKLSDYEMFHTRTEIMMRLNMMTVCALAFIFPMLVSDQWLPLTGFTYALLGPSSYLLYKHRDKKWQQINQSP